MNESEKQQIYQKWIERGRPWFDIDPKKEPTYAERQIIIEIKKRENTKIKYNIELEKSAAEIRERYGKKGMIPDKILSHKIFDAFDNY
jgi:hypothetical protein